MNGPFYDGILLGHKKEGSTDTCYNVDKPVMLMKANNKRPHTV